MHLSLFHTKILACVVYGAAIRGSSQQPTANSQQPPQLRYIRRLHANKSTFQLIIIVTLLLRFLTYSSHVGVSSESHGCMPVIEQWLLGYRRPAITIYLQ